jgi:cobalt transporter subunit CbtB
MTTLVRARTSSGVLPILAAALLGLGLVFVGGLAQSSVLHDAAHDVRHAIGFPCH